MNGSNVCHLHVEAFKRSCEILHAGSSSSLSNCGSPVEMTCHYMVKPPFPESLNQSLNISELSCRPMDYMYFEEEKQAFVILTTELWEYFSLQN